MKYAKQILAITKRDDDGHHWRVARGTSDDLLVISKMWCYECLKEVIPHVYTVQFDVEPQAAIVSWLNMRIVLETSETWAKEKTYRISPPFASDFRLLREFVIGRLKRLDEISPPVEECVRAACDLLSDTFAAVQQEGTESDWLFCGGRWVLICWLKF